jgi:formylmethanofuran dehydrogenase subunit E
MISQSNDVSWDAVASFHGHVCPGLVTGYRVAVAARDRLGLTRSEDEELVAIAENNSCAVDAIQVVLGCTFGKGNLLFKDHGKHVYTFHRRDRNGPAIRIRVRRLDLPEGLSREERVRAMLDAPEDQMLSITEVDAPPPAPARIEPSRTCARCGEEAMESRLRLHQGELLCLPCWRAETGETSR